MDKRFISVQVSLQMKEEVLDMANQKHVSESDIVRMALAEFIDSHKTPIKEFQQNTTEECQ